MTQTQDIHNDCQACEHSQTDRTAWFVVPIDYPRMYAIEYLADNAARTPIRVANGLTERRAIQIAQEHNTFLDLLEACKRDATLADVAIALTPTGKGRNRLTEINILRLAAIGKATN